ncbi:hypothetical protein [Sciscionella sediminilitoris]|uniref:hypothetical protein n=1 Tax=Sciscionella sediminilitoris TaxID=1445613 RepID=UPI0004DFB847|nr:hypothetical protein [Sciscionella sp. SE31]
MPDYSICEVHSAASMALGERCDHKRCREVAAWRIGNAEFCPRHAAMRLRSPMYLSAVRSRDLNALWAITERMNKER